MADYIEVNGAKIEREFFEENLYEARQGNWAKDAVDVDGHTHCLICQLAMRNGSPAYRSRDTWVCASCFDSLLRQ